jgi:archaeosortase B (VPXXXP-CTERM-specific)
LSPDPAENPSPGGGGAKPEPRRVGRVRAFWSVPTYRFALLFIALLTGIALAYPSLRLRLGHQIRALELFTAELVYALLGLFTAEARLGTNGIVFFGHFPVAIIDECTGIYEAVLLGAALLAFPTTWGKTAIGFLLGLPLIYAMNVARIVMLLVVGRYFPPIFEFMHIYFWQVTMIAMVSTTWLAWVIWVVRGDAAPPPPGDGARESENLKI